tara:strand:- start:1593 stop:3113 length:1521 start_codon:yes stop_codon:yes gene_type:complete
MDPVAPQASWLTVDGRFISKVGTGIPPFDNLPGDTHYIDCLGRTVLPGFNDSHTHILSSVAHETAVNCSPSSVNSIEDIKTKLSDFSKLLPKGHWIRAVGYDEFHLEDSRHPTRWDLDDAIPDYPVKLIHRSGHAMVLNSLAMNIAGITDSTVDPVGSVIERQHLTGTPTGLLFDMNDYISKVTPALSEEDISIGLGRYNELCLSYGLTSLNDASINNDLMKMDLLKGFKENGTLVPSINFMVGIDHLEDFLRKGIKFGDGLDSFRIGSVKIVLSLTTGVLDPGKKELRSLIGYANRNGFQVAIHAVENESIMEAVSALEDSGSDEIVNGFRNRIEHCSECTPDLMNRIIKNNIGVSTQPGFLYYNGQRYLAEVDERYKEFLYPIGSFIEAGVTLAYGSDSPVIPMNPMVGISTAVNRFSRSGDLMQPWERVSVLNAIKSYTVDSAYLSWQDKVRGSISEGKIADIILVDSNPLGIPPKEIINVKVLMTVVEGAVAWIDGERFNIV